MDDAKDPIVLKEPGTAPAPSIQESYLLGYRDAMHDFLVYVLSGLIAFMLAKGMYERTR
jgi:hypothetical protein